MSDTTTESSTNASQLDEPVPALSRRQTTAKRMQLTYHGKNDYSTSTLMLEGHDWTATDMGPLEDIMVSQRFTTLLQGHRESIRDLQLIHYNFGSLDNLVRLIAFFPSLTTLYLEGCSCGFTSTEQVSGHDYLKLPAIPLSLRSLGIKVEALYKPHLIFDTLALATWISTTLTGRHAYQVDLTIPFPLISSQLEYRQAIAQILFDFGNNLTQVNLTAADFLCQPTIRGEYEYPCPYPDFSGNRNLRRLDLDMSTSAKFSRMLLTSTLHTVNPSMLKYLGFSCSRWESEDLRLELLRPDQGLLQWLSSNEALTALRVVFLYLDPVADKSFLSRVEMLEVMRKQARALYDAKGCNVRCGIDSPKKRNFWGLPLAYFYEIDEDVTKSGGGVMEKFEMGKAAGLHLDSLRRSVRRDERIASLAFLQYIMLQ